MSKKTTPVHRIRHGGVEAAIWKNEGQNGPFFSVTFKRSYRTSEGDYKDSRAYTTRDLSALASAVMEAQIWISTNTPAEPANKPATKKKAS